MADQRSLITVINPAASKVYRVSLKGDVGRVSIRKLKRYLVPSCLIPADEQLLKYNGIELGDEVLGAEVGISHGSSLTVERKPAPSQAFVASPSKQAAEMEVLEQQRMMLQHERLRREEDFRRQQEVLQESVAQAERKKQDLEREKQQKEAELQRLNEMEQVAAAERERLAEMRRQEAERESLRSRDLETRKEQLAHERVMQRQLEMMKLENERKKMLLQQQKAEFEGERQRLERERKERQERIKETELKIREKEVELERQAVDAERARREIEMEKVVLQQQRHAEHERIHKERTTEAMHVMSAHSSSNSRGATPLMVNHSSSGNDGSVEYIEGGGGAATPSLAASGRHNNSSSGHNNAPVGTNATPRSASLIAKQRELETLRRQREALEQESNEEAELEAMLAQERSAVESLVVQKQHHTGNSAATNSFRSTPSSSVHPPHPASSSANIPPNDDVSEDGMRQLALDNLAHLAQDLGVAQLELDANNTCVVSIEDKYTLLVTFDPETQRLYLYTTLSNFIPRDAETKMRLYETLLEGALLGRDMCGGSAGISLKNDFVILSTSVYLPLSSPTSLRSITPAFVETLLKWRAKVREILSIDGSSLNNSSGPSGSSFTLHQTGSGHQATASSSHAHSTAPSQSMASTGGGGESAGYDHSDEHPVVGVEVAATQTNQGVSVVSAKGPAARAGIMSNDLIRTVNGQRIATIRDFQTVVRGLRPNLPVPFMVDRAGSHLLINVLIGSTRQQPSQDTRYTSIVRVPPSTASSPSQHGGY